MVAFGWWDRFVDPAHWRRAFFVRLLGASVIVATGLFQKLPGQLRWMPLMAKIRLVIAVAASLVAALLLDRGYGLGVAGIVAVILTGPYIAIDTRDLLLTNGAVLAAVGVVMFSASLNQFDAIGTIVFVTLAALVSTLLGRVLETSHRRAFALEIELHRDARTDALTGLNNRRAIQERGLFELKRMERSKEPLSVILCDIDHFKAINDRHGHEAGDEVLRTLSRALRAALRQTDSLGRWGGEELIVVLAETDRQMAVQVAERMRFAASTARFEAVPEGVTVSLGVSTCTDHDGVAAAWEALLKEADHHLYRAKADGRNRVAAASA